MSNKNLLNKTIDKNNDGLIDATNLPKMATQADSVAADVATLKTDFNTLLAKLKATGYMN